MNAHMQEDGGATCRTTDDRWEIVCAQWRIARAARDISHSQELREL
jgi:hypothetical protein